MNRMQRRARGSGDPRWIEARRRDVCAGCHDETKPGERVYYYPSSGKVYCNGPSRCGDQAAADFSAAAFDEAVYTGSW